MAQLLRTFGELITLATLGIPPAVLFCGLLALRRERSGRRDPGATAICDVVLVFAACCVLYLVGKPIPGQASTADLTPGTEIADAVGELPSWDPLWQAAANLLLLLPIGALVPLRSARLRSVSRVAGGAVVLSSTIETTQYLFLTGRVAATDDVVLNTLGATLGALLTRRWWARRRRELVFCDIPAPTRFRTLVPVTTAPVPATRSGPAWDWHRLRRVARPAGPVLAHSAFRTGKVLAGTSRAR
ncbi:VanZ family protein [Amycolatopsis minnesotensis]|uniref:VanZ-like domain-containing protein n=1 Tax=Amycolatopsis minnesotensis TaxID=337894 RepID=A0ABN2S8Q2_9PSEU